jgi:hypothetical protein
MAENSHFRIAKRERPTRIAPTLGKFRQREEPLDS